MKYKKCVCLFSLLRLIFSVILRSFNNRLFFRHPFLLLHASIHINNSEDKEEQWERSFDGFCAYFWSDHLDLRYEISPHTHWRVLWWDNQQKHTTKIENGKYQNVYLFSFSPIFWRAHSYTIAMHFFRM